MALTKDIKAIKAEAAAKRKAAQDRAARERDERNEEAELACAEALIAVDGDERRLIVMRLEESHGGAVVYRMPGEGYWDSWCRRFEASHIKSNGPSATTVTAGLAENKDLLVSPDVGTLQQWKDTFPGLYDTIRMTIQDRCGGLDPGKG